MVAETLLIIVSIIMAIIFHEFGHIITYNSMTGKYPKMKYIKYGVSLTYPKDSLTAKNRLLVNVMGIVAGLLPILYIADLLRMHNLILIVLLTFYFVGCMWDFKELLKELKSIYKGVAE